MKFELDFIVKAVSGNLLSSPHQGFDSYSVDNRASNIKDSLFIPLVGDAHDAHKFVQAAVEAGATGVLCHKWDESWEPLKEKASFILVDDTLKALQNFAMAWRQTLNAKVIGLTGSNGKTTTKDFLSQLLGQFGKTQASKGSFNNHWGVPFTLLDTDQDCQYCVVEMGMNHKGELLELNAIAKPEVVTVTNVGRAHMEFFEKGIEGVAEAKEEIYLGAPITSKFVFNVDNEWTRKMYSKYMDRPSFTFSNQNFSADVYFKIKKQEVGGYQIEGQIGGVLGKSQVHFWGEHNIQNLAAAVTLAYVAGVQPEKLWPAIKECHTGWGRNQWVQLKSGGSALFDAYNANPDSFETLLNNVQKTWDASKKYTAIFGEMLELGESSSSAHQELGNKAGELNWESCVFIGAHGEDFLRGWQQSKNEINPVILNTYEEFLDLKWPFVLNNELQLILKGSRGGKLERVLMQLEPTNFSLK